jgi:MYXO-CTERM domain-containing protein
MFALFLTTIPTALSNTPQGPYANGPLTPARVDAPRDGEIVWDANVWDPQAVTLYVDGIAADTLPLTRAASAGAPPRAVVPAPEGRWPTGVPLRVEPVDASGFVPEGEPLLFEAIEADAAPPPDVAYELDITSWGPDQAYTWGCCTDVRQLRLDVTVPDGDAWQGFEVLARYDYDTPNQITEQPIQSRLALEIGSGTHRVWLTQFMDEGVPQPPCIEVYGRSASGVLGDGQMVCALDIPDGSVYSPTYSIDDAEQVSEGRSCGCTSTTAPLGWVGWSALLLLIRRRRRVRRTEGCEPQAAL